MLMFERFVAKDGKQWTHVDGGKGRVCCHPEKATGQECTESMSQGRIKRLIVGEQ